MDDFKLTQLSTHKVLAFHIGSIRDVILGHVDEKLKNQIFKASDFLYGFSIGSPFGFSSLGEAMLVNNTLFSTCTDITSGKYAKVIEGDEFVTSGLFVIPKGESPTYQLDCSFEKSVNLYTFYQKIYDLIQTPFCFSGFFEFSNFHSNFIEKPPIFDLNIFENPKTYYTKPHIQRSNEYGFVIGIIADFNLKRSDDLYKQLESVLYKNPNEPSENLSYHTHVLTLEKTCLHEQEITQNTVKECLHLFCEKTTVKKANLKIFTLSDVRGFK